MKCYVFFCKKEATNFFQHPLCKEHFKKISKGYDKLQEIIAYTKNANNLKAKKGE